MKMRLLGLAALALMACAAQAEAAVTVSMGGGNSATSGTAGNIATFSSGAVSVQVSAWSLNGFLLSPAWLGEYSNGLGVTNPTEGLGTSKNSNAIDNQSGTDFVLLVFNQAVSLQSAVLTPYQVSDAPADNSVTVSHASLSGAYTAPTPTPVSLSSNVWLSLVGNSYSVPGNTTSPFSVALDPPSSSANVWLLAAGSFGSASSADGFRLSSITVASAPVPEPATWVIFCMGMGAIGLSIRQRRTVAAKFLQLA